MSGCPSIDALGYEPLGAEVEGHLATCTQCKIVAELLHERRRAEAARDRRTECARFELLIAVRDAGTITAPAAQLLDAHLRTCAECMAATGLRIPAVVRS